MKKLDISLKVYSQNFEKCAKTVLIKLNQRLSVEERNDVVVNACNKYNINIKYFRKVMDIQEDSKYNPVYIR